MLIYLNSRRVIEDRLWNKEGVRRADLWKGPSDQVGRREEGGGASP